MTFANPALLGLLAAGLAPVIIHLLSKRRFQRVAWAAMRWLLESLERNRRRLQIEELILLLIRIAIPVLLAFAIARPLLSSAAMFDRVIWLFFTIPLALAIWGAVELRAPARWRNVGRGIAGVLGVGSLLWVLFLGGADEAGGAGRWSLGESTHRVIVLDHSLSMRQQTGGRTAFDQGKRLAQWLLSTESGLRGGDTVTMLVAGDKPERMVNTHNFEAARRELKTLEPSEQGTDLPLALDEAYKILQQENRPRREIFVVTDLARHGWLSAGETLKSDKFKRLATGFTDDTRPTLTLIDAAGPPPANTAVTSIAIDTPVVTAGLPVAFRIQVKATSGDVERPLDVEVRVRTPDAAVGEGAWQEKVIASRRVNLSDGQGELRLYHAFTEAGPAVLTARIPDDSLSADNARHIALDVREAVRVLCVDGEPGLGGLTGATDLLVRALAPQDQESGSGSIFAPEQIDELQLPQTHFEGYDAVIFANVAAVPPEKRAPLRRYVADGGALVFFLGERVDPLSYNALFEGSEEQPQPLLPGRLVETRGSVGLAAQDRQTFSLADGPYHHPALRFFSGQEITLRHANIYKHFVCAVPQDDHDVDVVTAFADGTPAIVERRYGRGRVLLVTTSADKQWTNLPERMVYVPLMNELMTYLVSAARSARTVNIGRMLRLPLRPTESTARLTLTEPPPKGLKRQVAPSEEGRLFLAGPAQHSGPYVLRIAGPEPRVEAFAANPDPAESKLQRLVAREIDTLLGPVRPAHVSGMEDLKTHLERAIKGRELSLPLLISVLVLVLVETLLARVFGTRSTEVETRETAR